MKDKKGTPVATLIIEVELDAKKISKMMGKIFIKEVTAATKEAATKHRGASSL